LSRKAKAAKSDLIVFCGVKFMAEVAKILSPKTKVIVPDIKAGCSLEESCQPKVFAEFCKQHPDHYVVSYINCSAEIKALSDVIVTSSNATKIINAVPRDKEIIFAPDKHLGAYLIKETGREMLLWNGSCIVHELFSEKELVKLKTRHSEALTIAHPECPDNLLNHADHVGSTSSLLAYVGKNSGRDFIVLTEPGIIHQMKKLTPLSKFYDVKVSGADGACTHCNECPHMRLNTIEKLYFALKNEEDEIFLEEELANRARASLNKMLEY
jgi:quinolinate synthase